jgi:hypothetical protein
VAVYRFALAYNGITDGFVCFPDSVFHFDVIWRVDHDWQLAVVAQHRIIT